MTDVYRIFSKETRAITSDRKSFAGVVYDSNSTTIHFDLQDRNGEWDFATEGYRPFIVFDVFDQNGNPYVYGTDSSPMFSGFSFTVPYEITSNLRSARAEYRLWFVKAEVADKFNGTPDGLVVTEYLQSATDGIAFKPSCMKPKPPCGCPPAPGYAPSTAPSIIGPLEFYRENAVILPIDVMGHINNGTVSGLDMMVHTLSGRVQNLYLPVATIDEDGKINVNTLPTGNNTGQIPVLISSVGKGQAIIYDVENNGGFITRGFKGANLPAALRYVERSDENNSMHLVQLVDYNGQVLSTIDLPIENVVESAYYDAVSKDLVIVFGSGVETRLPLDDLVDIYSGVPGEIVITPGTGAEGQPTPYTIGLDPQYKVDVENATKQVAADLKVHKEDVSNPHKVTKVQVGLSVVDNTSDMDKPVSNAQRAAIDTAVSELTTKIDGDVNGLSSRISANATEIIRIDKAIYGDPEATDIEEKRGIIAQHVVDVQLLRNTDIALQSTLAKKADISYVDKIVEQKQDTLTGGVNIQIDDQNRINYVGPTTYVDSSLSSESTNPVQNKVINKALAAKQDKLVEGDNIAIVGNKISATLPKITVDSSLSYVSENPVQNRIIARELDRKANIGEGVSVWKGETSGGQYLYNAGDVVVYDWNLYVSKVDNNDHHPDDETCWNVVRSGALSQSTGITMPTYIGVFGNEASTDYTITHGLGTRNLIYTIMTNDSEHEFVTAKVSAPTLNTLRIRLTSPPGLHGLVVSVVKVRTIQDIPITEFPAVIGVDEPSTEWSYYNGTAAPLFAMTYDDTGNDIHGDIIQNSNTGYDPISIGFGKPLAGSLFLMDTAPANVHKMSGKSLTINTGDKKYLVQCYRDDTGLSILDIHQNDGKITVGSSISWTGVVCLYEATDSFAFTEADFVESDGVYKLTYKHNKGRIVGAQVYADAGLAIVNTHCPDKNTIEIYVGKLLKGELLII